jgi:hypothetical protein
MRMRQKGAQIPGGISFPAGGTRAAQTGMGGTI